MPFGVRATETVLCASADGVVDTATWRGHDGLLTDLDAKVVDLSQGPVSEDGLVDACRKRWRGLGRSTLCEAYADAEVVERYAATEFVSEQYGEVGAEPPGFPVVVRGRVRCEDVDLDLGPAAAVAEANDQAVPDRLRAWRSTATLNDWRAREAAWREAADGGCLDLDAVREFAFAAQVELEGTWPVLETARDADHPSHAGLCMDVRLHRHGYIEVGYHRVVSYGARSGRVDGVVDEAEPDHPQDQPDR